MFFGITKLKPHTNCHQIRLGFLGWFRLGQGKSCYYLPLSLISILIYTGKNQHRYGNWWVSVENISKHGGFSLFVNLPTRIISGTWWICFMFHKHVNLSHLPFSCIFYLVHSGFVSSHGETITSSELLLQFPRLCFERIQPNPLKMDLYLVVAFTHVICVIFQSTWDVETRNRNTDVLSSFMSMQITTTWGSSPFLTAIYSIYIYNIVLYNIYHI